MNAVNSDKYLFKIVKVFLHNFLLHSVFPYNDLNFTKPKMGSFSRSMPLSQQPAVEFHFFPFSTGFVTNLGKTFLRFVIASWVLQVASPVLVGVLLKSERGKKNVI